MVDLDELAVELSRKQERILLLMFRHGELKSREVGELTQFSRGSKNHQLGVLLDRELIEIIGWDEDAGRDGERILGLTDTGRDLVEQHLTEKGERPDEYRLRVERLEDDVDELETENEQLKDELESLRQDHEELYEKHRGLVDTLENELF
ncbi:hypothetical protein [Halalkalicoccus jeotgali]|uniref:Uncharacterized protein n=2 Tax=Halalkalicoccus jeotgali (strain DSM 18796 / CECT 7217 / JCM 14584 / KCTC 4019 / B3) TaxID=795797 RepID=L9VY35_HALJB|nr:hypothetical protein [Halalkalicoccus jeotgali]ELY41163.1 hypothetical protein C497_01957 [Halalkalicoccus jeotgali B3]